VILLPSKLLLYLGSVLILGWGIAHLVPTKAVSTGFGSITLENRRILVMEWISEGLTLCFLGLLVLVVTIFGGTGNPVSIIVDRLVAGMLVLMAGLTLFTGARTSIIPIKICPAIKTIAAVLILLGSL
jgi:hypothetical protein